MAVWYCGSVQYAAVTQFATSHAYTVGDIVRQLATDAGESWRDLPLDRKLVYYAEAAYS